VRNTRRSLELFERLHYEPSKIVVVVNRHDAKEPLTRQTIEEALGRSVQWSIPNDYMTVVRAINQGTALRSVQPKGALSSNIEKLATTILERPGSSAGKHARHGAGRGVRALLRRFSHGTT
jgi:Flp pilus assembly CpaE family ATPase